MNRPFAGPLRSVRPDDRYSPGLMIPQAASRLGMAALGMAAKALGLSLVIVLVLCSSAWASPLAPTLFAYTGTSAPDASSGTATVYGRYETPGNTGPRATCSFEYGSEGTFGLGSVPCVAEPTFGGAEPADVRAELPDLKPGSVYQYRLVASLSGVSEYGESQTFTETEPPDTPKLPIFAFSNHLSTTQAGGHPDQTTAFYFSNRSIEEYPSNCFCQDADNITTQSPAGVIGDPHAVPLCTAAQMGDGTCPPDTQVGWTSVLLFGANFFSPVYNVETDPDQAGLLGFELPLTATPAFIELSARTGGDYGLDSTLKGITQIVPPEGFRITLWGVPAEPRHDAFRVPIGAQCGDSYAPIVETGNNEPPCNPPTTPVTSTAPLAPFLDSPTDCAAQPTASLDILAYDEATSELEVSYPASTGCDLLSFNPSLSAQPTTTATDTPSGLEVDLTVPQQVSPEVPSPSEIRATTVKLPEGFSINPSAADGKNACTDAQARFGTEEEAQCPETSKVGTVTINSSALPAPLPGYAYLGQPLPGDRYRVFLVANGFATHIKLSGTVTPNPQTGQLTASFSNLPQSPFSEFNIHFFGSERGLLATPTKCGTYPVQSTFTPWDSALPEQSSTQFFTLSSGPGGFPCPGTSRPFSPSLRASSVNGTAGVHSPFSIELTRPDGDQNFGVIDVTIPPGVSATLKGVSYCPQAAIEAAGSASYSGIEELANPSCPADSLIGESVAGAGAGAHPVYIPGKVYLAGPYKGAPLSLVVITPAVSGPYDLGNVVVREGLNVNPQTAQVSGDSDPLPQIIEGIPLRLRSILVDLNRPNFTLNPTNCDPFAVDAEVFGSEGAIATPSVHFQVANCRNLSFAPNFSLKLSGATKRAGTPALQATVSYPKGGPYANIASTAVTLPHSEEIDQAHIKNVCTRVQFAAEACPPSSVLGHAIAETPLLEKPLEGNVYLMTGFGHKLPDLFVALKGQIDIDLDGRIDTVFKKLPSGEKVPGIRTTFATVPDAPISKFTLSLDGGKKGLLQNGENLCSASQRLTVKMSGQNGKTTISSPPMTTPCRTQHGKNHVTHDSRKAH